MPLYEYECDACGHRFEVIQKFSDPPLETCSKCGGPVRKLQSAPAFQFKGSGWYITDYARKDQTPAEKTEGAAKKDGAGEGAAADKVDKGEKKDSSKAEKPASASPDSASGGTAAASSSGKDSKTT